MRHRTHTQIYASTRTSTRRASQVSGKGLIVAFNITTDQPIKSVVDGLLADSTTTMQLQTLFQTVGLKGASLSDIRFEGDGLPTIGPLPSPVPSPSMPGPGNVPSLRTFFYNMRLNLPVVDIPGSPGSSQWLAELNVMIQMKLEQLIAAVTQLLLSEFGSAIDVKLQSWRRVEAAGGAAGRHRTLLAMTGIECTLAVTTLETKDEIKMALQDSSLASSFGVTEVSASGDGDGAMTDNMSRGLSGGAVAGIVIGAIAGVVLLAVAVGFVVLNNKRQQQEAQQRAGAYKASDPSPPIDVAV